jgi:hypothetical protein
VNYLTQSKVFKEIAAPGFVFAGFFRHMGTSNNSKF